MKSRILEIAVFCAALALQADAQTPTILSEPQSATNNIASAADFAVVASNAATYQWYFQGTNALSGETNATLSLDDLSTNQAGSYTVVVTSAGNLAATSAPPAVLTIVPGTIVQCIISAFPGGGSSNLTVQLFDHDKPATVENFIHYITSGVFSNMFFDRCVPGFVLQSGDYDLTNRASGNPLKDLVPMFEVIASSNYTPGFAAQVDNEFNVGPLIHNTFGTLAMAKTSGEPDSATHGFFFSLTNNSSTLDNENGGFTVFGRVISNANVLQYFNTLSKPDQGIFDSTTVGADSALPNLPVNYDGWASPADSNLFFADLSLLSPYTPDTTPPTVSITFPTNGQIMTKANVVVQGTASDSVGVANVLFSNALSTFYATGTTNWTADFGVVPPGNYTVYAVAQDGEGNISAQSAVTFTVPRLPFTGSVNGNGTLSTNLNGTNSIIGQTYTITAKPGKGAVFVNWSFGTNASLAPMQEFAMENGLQVTANFVSNNLPGGLSITFPRAGAEITNATFSITGKLAPRLSPSVVSCQVFSTEGYSVSSNLVIEATNTWSTPPIPVAPGDYIVQAVAQGPDGRAAVVSHKFTVLAPLSVTIYGHGHATLPNGAYLKVGQSYTEEAVPAAGQSFLSWNPEGGSDSDSFRVGTYPYPSFRFTMGQGYAFIVTFISNAAPGKLTITSPVANSQLTKGSFSLGGKIASSVGATQIFCQLFQNDVPSTSFMPATITGTTWTLPVSNLTMGIYNVVAIATGASGGTTKATEAFDINFYPRIAGTYKGLFFDPSAVTETTAGYVSFQLTANPTVENGVYAVLTGTLTSPQGSYPMLVPLSYAGSTFAEPKGFDGYLTLYFDVTNFSGQITGSAEEGGHFPTLNAYRSTTKLSTNTTPSPGHYVLSLEPENPTNGPAGDSFATVNIGAGGNLAVAGTMADDSTFSESTGVFTNGVWPLFARFDNGHGMLIGWETNLPPGTNTGLLYWTKSPAKGLYYTNGVNEQLVSIGAKYVAPAPGTNYQIVFGGGTLPSLVTNQFSFKADGAIVSDGTDQLKGSIVWSTGVLKGSIVNPANYFILDFRGAFISPAEGGSGFTLDADEQTGYFEITPVQTVPAAP